MASRFEDSKLKASSLTLAGVTSGPRAEIESTVSLAVARSSDRSARDELLDQLFTRFAETFNWEDELSV
jgi:hypothetical protein